MVGIHTGRQAGRKDGGQAGMADRHAQGSDTGTTRRITGNPRLHALPDWDISRGPGVCLCRSLFTSSVPESAWRDSDQVSGTEVDYRARRTDDFEYIQTTAFHMLPSAVGGDVAQPAGFKSHKASPTSINRRSRSEGTRPYNRAGRRPAGLPSATAPTSRLSPFAGRTRRPATVDCQAGFKDKNAKWPSCSSIYAARRNRRGSHAL